jgi:hypothetical protein
MASVSGYDSGTLQNIFDSAEKITTRFFTVPLIPASPQYWINGQQVVYVVREQPRASYWDGFFNGFLLSSVLSPSPRTREPVRKREEESQDNDDACLRLVLGIGCAIVIGVASVVLGRQAARLYNSSKEIKEINEQNQFLCAKNIESHDLTGIQTARLHILTHEKNISLVNLALSISAIAAAAIAIMACITPSLPLIMTAVALSMLCMGTSLGFWSFRNSNKNENHVDKDDFKAAQGIQKYLENLRKPLPSAPPPPYSSVLSQ